MKVIIIHASAGAGHQKAAEAVYDHLKQNSSHDVQLVDALDYSNYWFQHIYRGSYMHMITYVPALWGMFYYLVDIPILQPLVRFVRRIYNGVNVTRLQKHLVEQQFDYIITTHFMPNEIASALKRKGKINSEIITCVTDYDVHRIWLAKGIDKFCVASDFTHNKLIELGVEEDKIHVTGIPSHANFSKSYDIAELKNKLGIEHEVFTILIATGSFGIGPIEHIIDTLTDFQIIVVCGHNKHLYERLTARHIPHVKVMGLVNNMHELMAVSDAMVSKPGGLSITEALVSQLPLIFFNAIPGQETHNIQVLKTYGIGISDCTVDEIANRLRELRSSKDQYLTMLKKTKALAKPNAIQDISSLVK